MRGKAHSDETRAAVMAALLTGQAVSQIAGEFQLDESTVRNSSNRTRLELKRGSVPDVHPAPGRWVLRAVLHEYCL